MTSEVVQTMAWLITDAGVQGPLEIEVIASNGYSLGVREAEDGTVSKAFETGPPWDRVFPLEFHISGANGKKKTIILADECEACEVVQ